MGFSFIRRADTTSHGGKVLACTATNMVDGKALTPDGDMASCPKCGGVCSAVLMQRAATAPDGIRQL